jgi:hypothetical protein
MSAPGPIHSDDLGHADVDHRLLLHLEPVTLGSSARSLGEVTTDGPPIWWNNPTRRSPNRSGSKAVSADSSTRAERGECARLSAWDSRSWPPGSRGYGPTDERPPTVYSCIGPLGANVRICRESGACVVSERTLAAGSRGLPGTGGVPRGGHYGRNQLSGAELLAWLSAAGPRRTFSSRSSTSAHVLLHSASGPRICSTTASCSSKEDS